MTFKKGDKVEFRGGIWEFDERGCAPKGYCRIAYGESALYVSTTELKPIKSAHDKLIDMGYSLGKTPDGKEYYFLEETYIWINKLDKTYEVEFLEGHFALPRVIGLELSRVLTQFLEELEETK